MEVETLAMLDEALEAGADIIMLDNMDIETMKEAVKRTAGRAETECSGNVTKSRLKEIAAIGIDYVSCGALTHSAPILDFSLKNLSPDLIAFKIQLIFSISFLRFYYRLNIFICSIFQSYFDCKGSTFDFRRIW